MRLQDRPLSFVVNFLLGIAWAVALLGAFSSFLSFYQDSFIFAFIFTFVGALPGMIAILFIEHFITSKEKHFELQKQTELLKQLLKENKTHITS